MRSPRFIKLAAAADLPSQWDELATCIFQRKDFLCHAEAYNPCRQRYYLLWDGASLRAAACVYTLGVDLFTFSRIPSRVPMQIIGLPASVSAPGLFGSSPTDAEALLQYLLEVEKGLVLGLNLDGHINPAPGVGMTMLPTVQVQLPFTSWEHYMGSMRSPYRRRARIILEAFSEVEKVTTGCALFTTQHHDLYLQILKRTPNKLEVLSADFFRNLPGHFYLTSCYREGRLLCWHINCTADNLLYFFFGGHDYALLEKHHAYFNNLFSIIQEGIEGGHAVVDLGQTAEIAKVKVGGDIVDKSMFFYHRNPVLHFLLKAARPFITYHPPSLNYHILKKDLSSVHQTTAYEHPIREANAAS